jgi:hypothetical protein
VVNRSGIADARPSAVAANSAVQAAAQAAPAAISRCGATRSARFSAVDPTAPSTKPSCTDAVSHTAAGALTPQSARSAGTTADAENHTASASTCTAAIRARCAAGRRVTIPLL